LQTSEWGRLVAYLGQTTWYDRQSSNQCLFSNKDEAIRWARFEAQAGSGGINWESFPDPRKKYPYDDRDGSREFTPVFRITWDREGWGKGSATVVKMEISDVFDWYATNGVPEPLVWDRAHALKEITDGTS